MYQYYHYTLIFHIVVLKNKSLESFHKEKAVSYFNVKMSNYSFVKDEFLNDVAVKKKFIPL